MASNFYHNVAPDYTDPDNKTGSCPGFALGVRENDGGIGVYMFPANTKGDDEHEYGVFLNINEARDLVSALQEAIERAAPKNKPKLLHRPRVRKP